MSAIYEAMGPGGHEAYATSIFSKIKTYLDSNPYGPVKDVPNTPIEIATFDDGSDLPMPSLKVAIEPQQDLHGYDAPWAGGAGKNKLQVTATSQTITGVTVTVKDDGTFVVNGTATQKISLQLSRKSVNDTPLPEGQLIMTGCPSGGSTSSYYLTCWRTNSGNANDVGNGITFSYLSDWDFVVSLIITSGTVCNNLTFKPMIRLASVQDATFAPYSNICPISGWDEVNVTRCGKNLWGGLPLAQDIEQVAYQPTLDTTNKTLIFTNAKPIEGSYSHPIPNGISYKENTQYTFIFAYKNNGKNNCLRISYTDGNTEAIELDNSSGTKIFKVFTTQSNKTVKDIIFSYYSNVQTYLYYEESGLFEGELTASDFEPYNGHTYTIDLDGTRYGGTLDVVSGVLTVDREYVDLGTLNWTYSSDVKLFTTSVQGIKGGIYTDTNLLSSIYPVKPISYSQFDYGMRYNSATSIGVKNPLYTDATTFKTAMNGVQLVYELATPQTIQLTPTQVKSLLGSNNVWADTGDVLDAEYIRDKYDNITAKYAAYAYNSGNADTATSATTASKLGSSNVGSATQPIYLNAGTATACTYTLGKSVPSGAIFTDAKVTQTATDGSSNAEYEVLFSGTADNTTRTEGARKTSLFTFNPQTNQVTAGHFTAESSSPSGNETASLVGYDVQLGGTSNTWDGTNTSLKTAISTINNNLSDLANKKIIREKLTVSSDSNGYALTTFTTSGYQILSASGKGFGCLPFDGGVGYWYILFINVQTWAKYPNLSNKEIWITYQVL